MQFVSPNKQNAMSIRNHRVVGVSRTQPYSRTTAAATVAAAARDIDGDSAILSSSSVENFATTAGAVSRPPPSYSPSILTSEPFDGFLLGHSQQSRWRPPPLSTTSTAASPPRPRERVKFECAICMESYVEEKFDNSLFLVPKTCTHAICFKCVVGMYNNNRIGMRKCPPLKCPMCNTAVPFWVTYTKNSTVECRFYKRTECRQANQVTVAYCNHWDRMKARYVNHSATTPNEDDAIAESNATLCAENEKMKNKLHELCTDRARLQAELDYNNILH
uniref:DekiORF5 n=1 Tax=Dendrolimus kikuchii nucleopolyhedrovirus TaxID=1219875 RepID=V9LSN5_9ABAC|nr:DekiORF5 [Dendrolimus kikuchii nucleopolyhedrovirus]